MRLSAQKSSQFQAQIRRKHLNSLFQKMRYEVIGHIEKQNIDSLIAIPYHSFNQENLQALIEYANNDHTNAILHLGNMVIDGMLQPVHLEGVRFKLGNNEYWCWLANVLAEAGFMSQDILEYVIDKIARKKSQGSLLNALEAFERILKPNPAGTISILLNHEKVLYGLLGHIYDSQDKIVLKALQVLVEASSGSEQFPRAAVSIVGKQRIQQAIMHASMKLMTRIRILAVQATNNFLLSGVLLEVSISRWLENTISEKDGVKLQLSYLFEAVVRTLPFPQLKQTSGQLSYVLRKLYESNSQSKHVEETRENARNGLIALEERISTSRLMQDQACRGRMMRDESEDITECHEMC